MSTFAVRDKQPEIMDQPGLDAAQHRDALRGLARVNWISGSDRILWPAICRLALEKKGQPIRVLDVATGAGDVPIRLYRRAQKARLPVEFSGVDISATALEYARAQANQQGAEVHFFALDALNTTLPTDYDVITSSLFLHHLAADEATALLRQMGQAARSLVLINDLRRSRVGYWMAWLGTRVLTASPIVHVDGPRSVAGAFSMAEALAMAEEAGLHGAAVSGRWPFRFLLQWRRRA